MCANTDVICKVCVPTLMGFVRYVCRLMGVCVKVCVPTLMGFVRYVCRH